MPNVDTEKPDLTVTTAIRLLLNEAASVDEAVKLLKLYDIHASGGISHHLSVSDASGASVSIEFTEEGFVTVNTNAVTNFNLTKGDTAAGGESARQRFDYLCAIYKQSKGTLNGEQVKDALKQAAQTDGKWTTQWSAVFEQKTMTVQYYFDRDFENAYSFSVGAP